MLRLLALPFGLIAVIAGAAPPPPSVAPEVDSFSSRRQQAHAALRERLEKARANLLEAERARESGGKALPEELQVVQRRFPPLQAGQSAPFPNCANRQDPASGSLVLICPTQVPGAAYYQRQRQLDEDLAAAERELADAERAYRRGMD